MAWCEVGTRPLPNADISIIKVMSGYGPGLNKIYVYGLQ